MPANDYQQISSSIELRKRNNKESQSHNSLRRSRNDTKKMSTLNSRENIKPSIKHLEPFPSQYVTPEHLKDAKSVSGASNSGPVFNTLAAQYNKEQSSHSKL